MALFARRYRSTFDANASLSAGSRIGPISLDETYSSATNGTASHYVLSYPVPPTEQLHITFCHNADYQILILKPPPEKGGGGAVRAGKVSKRFGLSNIVIYRKTLQPAEYPDAS